MNDKKKNNNHIFGTRPIIEAIKNGKTIDKIFVQKGVSSESSREIMKLIRDNNINFQFVPVEKLNRLTRKNHQGFYAYISEIDFFKIEDILPQIYEQGKTPFILILDGVTDVRNFGAIARSAQCVGIDAIVVPSKDSAPVNADAVKTSAGALYNIPVCKEKNLKTTIEFLQNSGINIVSCSEKSNETIYDLDFTVPVAIIMGSEKDGISSSCLKISDHIAKIPMNGTISSLNVSVACGVIIYEAMRQRINI